MLPTIRSLRSTFLASLILALLGLLPNFQQNSTALIRDTLRPIRPADTFTGHLCLDWTCFNKTHDAETLAPKCLLMDGKGQTLILKLPSDLVESYGGLSELNGKRITVVGEQSADNSNKIDVESFYKEPEEAAQNPAQPQPKPNAVTTKPFITILVRFSDSTQVTPFPVSWYNTLMGMQKPGIAHYFQEMSYGKVDISGSKTVGWYNLNTTLNSYKTGTSDWDNIKLLNDAIVAASHDVDFTQYYGINVITNKPITDGGGKGGRYWLTINGTTRIWGTTVCTSSGHVILAHEMGHALGLDHSNGYTPYESQWDVMSSGRSSSTYKDWGPLACETNAYHKWILGSIPPSRVFLGTPGTTATFDLERLERPVSSQNYLMAQIFIGGLSTKYYTLETRRYVGYDADMANPNKGAIPRQGVLMHICDLFGPGGLWGVSRVVDRDNNGNSNDDGAVLIPGQTFDDRANGITIKVNSVGSSSYNVTIKVASNVAWPNVISNTSDSGAGSLRNALYFQAYMPTRPPLFHISTLDSNYASGVFSLKLRTPLPEIQWAGLVIDGAQQTAYTGNTNTRGPEIQIDGSAISDPNAMGFNITAPQCTIRNLAIGGFHVGTCFRTAGVTSGNIQSCYLGTTATGDAALPNTWAGIVVSEGASHVTIGGSKTSTGNLVSGNAYGIAIVGSGTSGHIVQGNWIGLAQDGKTALRNTNLGITIYAGASDILLGGNNPGEGNVVSGNGTGIYIQDEGTTTVTVQGNLIGTDVLGKARVGNLYSGVFVGAGVTNTLIGGANSGAGNVISGNTNGIEFSKCVGNRIQGNFIGTDVSGRQALPNQNGLYLGMGVSGTLIGGEQSGTGNTISGNQYNGMVLGGGTTLNKIQGNYVGLAKDGLTPLPNQQDGIVLTDGATKNQIGGATKGAGNVSSGNKGSGIVVWGIHCDNNIIQGNYLGVDVSGTIAVGNTSDGVVIGSGAQKNLVGGVGAGNLIANNSIGILFWDKGTEGNSAIGNLIGTDITKLRAMGNGWVGVAALNGAANNKIGDVHTGEGNVIANSGMFGVIIRDNGIGNTIRGNSLIGNVDLGIELVGNDGAWWVTPNDALDIDTGPNNLQNYPDISTVALSGKTMIISGSLNSTPNTIYSIDIYTSSKSHASGHGEGEIYLGSVSVKTNSTGIAKFSFNATKQGSYVATTATRSDTGDTSEFSESKAIP